jgi:hypothetical protein
MYGTANWLSIFFNIMSEKIAIGTNRRGLTGGRLPSCSETGRRG